MTFNECTYMHEVDNMAWCATKVDDSGNHFYEGDEYEQENWGNCAPNCPVTEECLTTTGPNPNKPCIFPFHYRNMTFNACTWYDADSAPWCATKVDDSGNHFFGEGYDQEN